MGRLSLSGFKETLRIVNETLPQAQMCRAYLALTRSGNGMEDPGLIRRNYFSIPRKIEGEQQSAISMIR